MRSIAQPGAPVAERIQWVETRGRAFTFTLEAGLPLRNDGLSVEINFADVGGAFRAFDFFEIIFAASFAAADDLFGYDGNGCVN